jgi:hypothetical protein
MSTCSVLSESWKQGLIPVDPLEETNFESRSRQLCHDVVVTVDFIATIGVSILVLLLMTEHFRTVAKTPFPTTWDSKANGASVDAD